MLHILSPTPYKATGLRDWELRVVGNEVLKYMRA